MKHFSLFYLDHTLDLLNWLLDRDCWPFPIYRLLIIAHNRAGRSWVKLRFPEAPAGYIRLIPPREENEVTWAELP